MKAKPDNLKNDDVNNFINAAKDEKINKEVKNVNSKEVKNLTSEELTIKRSYTLRPSTIRKLQELKVFVYTDPSITYNEIVDEAINSLYDTKKK